MRKSGKILLLFLLCIASIMLCGFSAFADEGHESISCFTTGKAEDVRVSSRFFELIFGKGPDRGHNDSEQPRTAAAERVILGGDVFGARIKQSHPTVSDAGEYIQLRCGDIIVEANGKSISCADDLAEITRECKGEAIHLTVKRGDACINVTVSPKESESEYTLPISVRDGAAGIGTITYIDPDSGEFGGLGHGISDADNGKTIELRDGCVTDVILGSVQKGESGKPGELCGILTDRICGDIYLNTDVGIFGRLAKIPDDGRVVEVADRDEVKGGEATMICTLKNGKKGEYKIEIFDIDKDSSGTKSFKIRATDPALIAISGGIVRGMSGSPIIQDGKLVGAVTHVMVADPTEGYGIFIENMLSAAEGEAIPKAA